MKHKGILIITASVLLIALVTGGLMAQRGPRGPQGARGRGGPGFRGGRQDPSFEVDHEVFFFLLSNGDKIRREVKNLNDGVETITESDDPEISAKIQEHVAAMYDRVEEPRPIHMRDPLFAAIFRNAAKIEMKAEDTDKGVRVVETSKDPYVAKLIQEHAKVVSLFIKNGHAELRKNHALPKRDGGAASASVEPAATGCCGETGCCGKEGKCKGL